ncbi:MAG: GAK system CofD-like protein [Planctomycetes bacterium]|nr:GAK system CofD-like protein [Planctomycetota bacterium]
MAAPEAVTKVNVSRTATVPDVLRVARCQRSPDLGPRILFFSGGTALRDTSRILKDYTHNSVHLITPFDSGGSSAKLRDAFDMISVGDLRNRLLALADTKLLGHPEIYNLFNYRLPKEGDESKLRERLDQMTRGEDNLVASVPDPMRSIICNNLRFFLERMPSNFDLFGASIGNLILTGGYLNNDRDIEAVTFLFSKLVEVRGTVKPIVGDPLHIAAKLLDSRIVMEQHNLTAKETKPLTSPIERLYLSKSRTELDEAKPEIAPEMRDLIRGADLICYPMGSFYTSIVACLLPKGVGSAVAGAGCPKVYVPNCGFDIEASGLSLSDAVERLMSYLSEDPGCHGSVLDFILLDSRKGSYPGGIEKKKIVSLGVTIIDTKLISKASTPYIDALLLTEALLSLT